MRILVVADFYRHGCGRIIEDRASDLIRRGHQVKLLAGCTPERIPMENRAALREGLNPVLIPWNAGEHGSRTLFRRVLAFRNAFEKLCSRTRFDAIVFYQPLSAWAVLQSPFSRGLPTLYSFLSPWPVEWAIGQGLEVKKGRPARKGIRSSLNFFTRKWMERKVLVRSSRIAILSDFMRAQLAMIHPRIGDEKISFIPGGVDLERFHPTDSLTRRARRAALGLPPDAPLLLTVRRLVPRMGLETLLRAFHKLRRIFPDLHLVIGGSGPLEGLLRSQSEALGISPRVRFLGYVPELDLPGLYAAADLFILPTAQLEGFGLVTVEALACGTPVVGTPIGATPEILQRVHPRLLAKSETARDIADATASLLHLTPEKRQEIGALGRRVVSTLYDRTRIGTLLEGLLIEITGPRSISRPRRRVRESALSRY